MKLIMLVGVSLLILSTVTHAEWTGPHKKHHFPQIFPTGWEADGRKLYSSQCVKSDVTVQTFVPVFHRKNYGWYIGKAGTHLPNGMMFSWRGKEYDSSHCRHNEHFVFVPDAGVNYKWVSASNGAVPGGSVKGANGAEDHSICRVNWAGGKHPGKLIPGAGACFFGYGGEETAVRSYEVLVKD